MEAQEVRYEMQGEDTLHEIGPEGDIRRISRPQELQGPEHSKELEKYLINYQRLTGLIYTCNLRFWTIISLFILSLSVLITWLSFLPEGRVLLAPYSERRCSSDRISYCAVKVASSFHLELPYPKTLVSSSIT